MDALPEVIFAAGDNCIVYDYENGNNVQTYKAPAFVPNTLSLIGEDYLIAAVANKPSLKVWTSSRKFVEIGDFPVPGLVTALAVTSCGSYCVAGINKLLYIWKVCTGELLTIVEQHYQDITCIKFNVTDSHLISGGKDGHVNVWLLSRLIDVGAPGNRVKPRFVWSHHSAEVTDIYVGSLGHAARVATTSSDMTCRLYELETGKLMCTICMTVPLTAVTMDTLEFFVFIGDVNGALHRVDVYEKLPRELNTREVQNSEFKIHDSRIFYLGVTFEGTRLVSAAENSNIRIWDLESLSCVLKIEVPGKLTNAFVALKPTSLSQDVPPQFCITKFRKEQDAVCRDPNLRKFQESKSRSKPISSMLYLPSELRCSPAHFKPDSMNMDALSDTLREDMFQRIVNGGTIAELTAVNNQIYTYVTDTAFAKLAGRSVDSDEEIP